MNLFKIFTDTVQKFSLSIAPKCAKCAKRSLDLIYWESTNQLVCPPCTQILLTKMKHVQPEKELDQAVTKDSHK